MEGGELITQGAYGCIFDKPLQCKGKRVLKRTGKIAKITETLDANNELQMAKLLRKAPLWRNYFILADPESCKLQREEKQTEEDLPECRVLERVALDEMKQMIMPWGGKSLHDYDIHPRHFSLVKFMIHMLEAVGLMTLQGICHYDIHPGNIVVDPHRVARLIDFGMAFHGPSVTNEILGLRWKILRFGDPTKNEHWISNQEPPEVTIINAIINNGFTLDDAVEKTIFTKDIFRQLEKPMFGISRGRTKRAFIKFWNQSKTCQERHWAKFFQLYWTGFDSWALGTLFYEFLIRQLTFRMFAESESWKEKQHSIQATLTGLLEINPLHRLDAIEALSILDPGNKWLNRFGGAWISARARQREKLASIDTVPVAARA